jgi:hypothetical protein
MDWIDLNWKCMNCNTNSFSLPFPICNPKACNLDFNLHESSTCSRCLLDNCIKCKLSNPMICQPGGCMDGYFEKMNGSSDVIACEKASSTIN